VYRSGSSLFHLRLIKQNERTEFKYKMKKSKLCDNWIAIQNGKIHSINGILRKGTWIICLDCKRIGRFDHKLQKCKETFAQIILK